MGGRAPIVALLRIHKGPAGTGQSPSALVVGPPLKNFLRASLDGSHVVQGAAGGGGVLAAQTCLPRQILEEIPWGGQATKGTTYVKIRYAKRTIADAE